jgi:prepilin peptidase CpaA
MTQHSTLVMTMTLGFVMIAAVMDLLWRRVHNLVTISMIVSGLFYHAWQAGVPGAGTSLLAVVVAGGVLMIPFLLGGLGGGDVKLLAGVGAWTLLPSVLLIFLVAGLLAGFAGVLQSCRSRDAWDDGLAQLMALPQRLAQLGRNIDQEDWAVRQITEGRERRQQIPFAFLIALGVLVDFFCLSGQVSAL